MCDMQVVLVYQLLVQCLSKVRMRPKSRFMTDLSTFSITTGVYHNSSAWQLVHIYNGYIYNSHSILQSSDRHLWLSQPLTGKLTWNFKSQLHDITLIFTWDNDKTISFLGEKWAHCISKNSSASILWFSAHLVSSVVEKNLNE